MTSSIPKPSNSGPGNRPASSWAVMNSAAPMVTAHQGRATAASMRRISRKTDRTVEPATQASTSSSHCMPVPSGALNGTANARPISPSATVQRISRGIPVVPVMQAS